MSLHSVVICVTVVIDFQHSSEFETDLTFFVILMLCDDVEYMWDSLGILYELKKHTIK